MNPALPRGPLDPRGRTETLKSTLPILNGWMHNLSATLRARMLGVLGSPAHEQVRLRVSDIRTLVQELDTHQVELEQQNEELRSAQLALVESRDRLSDLYEFAPIGYLTLDVGGVIRQSNLAAAQLLGPSRQRLQGKRLASFIPAEDVDRFQQHFSAALRGEPKTQCELSIQRQDRQHSVLKLRLESIRLRESEMAADHRASCQIALIDITDASQDRIRLHELNRGLEQAVIRRTADLGESVANLRTHEQRLGLALDAGRMGTWTLDLLAREVWRDERHECLYGRTVDKSHDSLDGWIASLHPEDRERMTAVMSRAISGADPVLSAEYRILWPDGSAHWLAVRGRVIFDARGKPRQVVGVEQDIDERKSLEMEILHIADREQRRIGQELHDDIQQRLTGLGLMAASLCDAVESTAEAAVRVLCLRIAQGIAETTERINHLSHGLVPLELDGEGLLVALHRLAASTNNPGRLECIFRHDADLEIRDGFTATHLYRIAQEAITNATRHSGARHITLSITRNAEQSMLIVTDDGVGLRAKRDDGRGLRIMAYRASLIGATLRVGSQGSQGTEVSCTFPLGHTAPQIDTSP